MASAFAHVLHTIVIPKYDARIAAQGKGIQRGKFEPLADQTKEITLAEAVLDLASLGMGEVRAAILHGENRVWQVS